MEHNLNGVDHLILQHHGQGSKQNLQGSFIGGSDDIQNPENSVVLAGVSFQGGYRSSRFWAPACIHSDSPCCCRRPFVLYKWEATRVG